jgi:hypothetical protein
VLGARRRSGRVGLGLFPRAGPVCLLHLNSTLHLPPLFLVSVLLVVSPKKQKGRGRPHLLIRSSENKKNVFVIHCGARSFIKKKSEI